MDMAEKYSEKEKQEEKEWIRSPLYALFLTHKRATWKVPSF